LAHLAQNKINQLTIPAVEVEDPQSEAEGVDQEQEEGGAVGKILFKNDFQSFSGTAASAFTWDSADEESSLEGRCPCEDLPVRDSYSPLNSSLILCWVVTWTRKEFKC
jgi:hypothetical protein